MNDKHKKFADEYLIDSNASRAYVAAGYSAKTPDKNAYKLLEREDIKQYIKDQQVITSEKVGVTREEIINDLRAIKDSFKGADKFPPHAMKAIEILNKMLGFNEPDKTDITTNGKDINDIKISIIRPKTEDED